MVCKDCDTNTDMMYPGTNIELCDPCYRKRFDNADKYSYCCVLCGRYKSWRLYTCTVCTTEINKAALKKQKEKESMTNQITIKLDNGATITGTFEQVQATAKALNIKLGQDGVHYLSSRLGLITIASMTKEHIKNALLKIAKDRHHIGYNDSMLVLAETNITCRALLTEYLKKI